MATVNYLNWFAEEARLVYGDLVPAPRVDQPILVQKEPLGICAAITPWNFPLSMIPRKAGPAITAGCSIIVKPAELTSYSALALAGESVVTNKFRNTEKTCICTNRVLVQESIYQEVADRLVAAVRELKIGAGN